MSIVGGFDVILEVDALDPKVWSALISLLTTQSVDVVSPRVVMRGEMSAYRSLWSFAQYDLATSS